MFDSKLDVHVLCCVSKLKWVNEEDKWYNVLTTHNVQTTNQDEWLYRIMF